MAHSLALYSKRLLTPKLFLFKSLSFTTILYLVSMLSHVSHVWLLVTLWTVAHHALLTMGFSRQENWSGLPCPTPEDLPNPGIEPCLMNLLHCKWILFH